jgi:hypothetical protein
MNQATTVLAASVFGAIVAQSTYAADRATLALLPPRAQIPFQEYGDVSQVLGFKAFAIEVRTGRWGSSERFSLPGIAIDQAIEDCLERFARECTVFAIGDIVVHGLAERQAEVAVMLYQAKRGATNGDLDAVTTAGGGGDVAVLRDAVFLTAAEMGRTPAVAALLDVGVALDAVSEVGVTALMYAASRGRKETVALLLEHGAAVNARSDIGRTALGVAMLAGNFAKPRDYIAADHDAVIEMLRDAGGVE